MSDFQVDPSTLKGAAATMHDLAHDLRPGQFDLFLLDWADAPASHPDVARAMSTFGRFAHDQYQDVLASCRRFPVGSTQRPAATRRPTPPRSRK